MSFLQRIRNTCNPPICKSDGYYLNSSHNTECQDEQEACGSLLASVFLRKLKKEINTDYLFGNIISFLERLLGHYIKNAVDSPSVTELQVSLW